MERRCRSATKNPTKAPRGDRKGTDQAFCRFKAENAIISPLHPVPGKALGGEPPAASLAIERFLKASRKPVLIEPGEAPFPVSSETFVVTVRGTWVTIECWDARRNLSRRVTGVSEESPGRLELDVERFGEKSGTITLADLGRAKNHHLERDGKRHKYREHFRESLHRQFPDWRVDQISSQQDLNKSFSPVFPRALLRKGNVALAAIGAPEDSAAPEAALCFGLIWLDYLRRQLAKREAQVAVEGLALFVPAGRENTLCHRIRFLNPQAAYYFVFVYEGHSDEQRIDPCDYTNLETWLEPPAAVPRFSSKRYAAPSSEAVLESLIRTHLEEIDATLLPSPVYGQVPQFAGGDRGLMDLVAVDREGRLAVLELKVSQDIHLPLQALDYWMRVRWHLDRGDFTARGFFPEIALSMEAPRILLVAPAMEFHPTNETVLSYLSPDICVERVGIGLEWRRELKVVYRPDAGLSPSANAWPSPSSDKSNKRSPR